jgi:hypothetical protein
VIQPDAAKLLQSPCALIVGTVDADGLPDATRGWGLVVERPCEVRLLLSSNADATLANLATTGVLAVTATHFATLVSFQLKGRARAVEPATAEDRIVFDRFCAGCLVALEELEGAPPEVTARMVPPGVVACVMDVTGVFDQTPGPAAGALLAPTDGGAAS